MAETDTNSDTFIEPAIETVADVSAQSEPAAIAEDTKISFFVTETGTPIQNDESLPGLATLPESAAADESVQSAVITTSIQASNDDIDISRINQAVIIAPSRLLANDKEINGGAITPQGFGNPVNGEVSFNGKNIIFMPTLGYVGPASFDYTISNDQGELSSATVNLTIEATDANFIVDETPTFVANPIQEITQPVITTTPLEESSNAIIEAVSLAEPITQTDASSLTSKANDDVIPATVADPVIISPALLLRNDEAVSVDSNAITYQNSVNGTVSFNGEDIVFVPASGYTGPASFDYTITGIDGELRTATVNLSIGLNVSTETPTDPADEETISFFIADGVDNTADTPIINEITNDETAVEPTVVEAIFNIPVVESEVEENQAPSAVDDAIEATSASPVVISLATLLANDSDPDGDTLTPAGLGDAKNGNVIFDGTNVIFTPFDGYEGPASFTYIITDGNGANDTATVNLTIAPSVVEIPSNEVLGDPADNTLVGDSGNNFILGNQGNDNIDAVAGSNLIQGGQGDDILTGGTGSDTFIWRYNAIQPWGNGLETDVITNFGENDQIDLRELLQNIQSNDANLTAAQQLIPYINFSYDAEAGGTVMAVSVMGSFIANEIGQFGDQKIIIAGVDWTQDGTESTQTILDTLIANNILVTDAPGFIDGNPSYDTSQTQYNETLTGGAGDNQLFGGAGDDIIMGGAGNDVIQGGQGNDVMDGGLGSDTFVWRYNAIQPWGNGREVDVINNAHPEDTLDLRDFLQNLQSAEANQSAAERLDPYLNFYYDAEVSDTGGTVMAISAMGSFDGDNSQLGDQLVVLNELDLTNNGSFNDIDIINNLITNNNLLTGIVL